MIGLRREMLNFSRQTDARLALLREVVQKVKNGEPVDVRRVLGTGDEKHEAEWEEVVKELESTDMLWEDKVKRDKRRAEMEEQKNAKRAQQEEERAREQAEAEEGRQPCAKSGPYTLSRALQNSARGQEVQAFETKEQHQIPSLVPQPGSSMPSKLAAAHSEKPQIFGESSQEHQRASKSKKKSTTATATATCNTWRDGQGEGKGSAQARLSTVR
nr:hypothetical protein CFP56_76445 [Quercus suber]